MTVGMYHYSNLSSVGGRTIPRIQLLYTFNQGVTLGVEKEDLYTLLVYALGLNLVPHGDSTVCVRPLHQL